MKFLIHKRLGIVNPPKRFWEEQAEVLRKSSLLPAFSEDVVKPSTNLPQQYCHFIISDPSVLASYIAAKEIFPQSLSGTPLTHEQAMSSPEADFWKKIEEIEVSGLEAKNTWIVVERALSNVHFFSGKFVYKKKMNLDGTIRCSRFWTTIWSWLYGNMGKHDQV